jgi:Ser/Thr protein kinase RdoA (MazF antagonist)
MNSNAELFSMLDKLADGCRERRALAPLGTLLGAYPMVSPLTDSWGELRNALRNLRCLREPVVTEREADDIKEALRAVEKVLGR